MYFKNSNTRSLSIVLIVVVLTFSSCIKDLPLIFKDGHYPSEKPMVFVAGEEWNGTYYVARYWVDGQEIILSDGTGNAITSSIFVSNSDVYVAGSDNKEFSGVVYWKNNKEIQLSSGGAASSIFVSGNDVYVAGNDVANAVYWKNGVEITLEKTNVYGSFGSSTANSVFFSGNDIYIAGYDGPNAVYWKNGEEKYLTTKNTTVGGNFVANSIYVSGNDVYIAGSIISATTQFPQIWYWKNEVLVPVNQVDSFGLGSSIFVSGNDVYLAGVKMSDPTSIETASYWKNCKAVQLSTSNMNSWANSIFVLGRHVYVAGYETLSPQFAYAVYWRDGVETKLTDGTHQSLATSIFVK